MQIRCLNGQNISALAFLRITQSQGLITIFVKSGYDETPLTREIVQNKVTVATVYGRSYYKIINALKLMDIQFESVSPEEAALSNAKIIITTRDEAEIVRRKDVLLDTELDDYPVFMKAKILRNIMGPYHDDQLTIGIDPGIRIGVSVIFLHNEIESVVESSPESAIKLVSHLISRIRSNKKVVRIGNGNIVMATQIAMTLKTKFKELVDIEIVDEHGTSQPQNTEANRRGARDRASARTIALRNGKPFKSSSSPSRISNGVIKST
ncbi:MAG TPA: hypothetical protein VE244_05700 [Nitrososphaeraceae archaeon]|nr:hypothetical protein [Nitrososphaeraceae archaeon]